LTAKAKDSGGQRRSANVLNLREAGAGGRQRMTAPLHGSQETVKDIAARGSFDGSFLRIRDRESRVRMWVGSVTSLDAGLVSDRELAIITF
jgi:hypothetical protein